MRKQIIRATAVIVQGLIAASSLKASTWPSVTPFQTTGQTQFTWAADSAYGGDTQDCWMKSAFSNGTARTIHEWKQGKLLSNQTYDPNVQDHSAGSVLSYINQEWWSSNTYSEGYVKLQDPLNNYQAWVDAFSS